MHVLKFQRYTHMTQTVHMTITNFTFGQLLFETSTLASSSSKQFLKYTLSYCMMQIQNILRNIHLILSYNACIVIYIFIWYFLGIYVIIQKKLYILRNSVYIRTTASKIQNTLKNLVYNISPNKTLLKREI